MNQTLCEPNPNTLLIRSKTNVWFSTYLNELLTLGRHQFIIQHFESRATINYLSLEWFRNGNYSAAICYASEHMYFDNEKQFYWLKMEKFRFFLKICPQKGGKLVIISKHGLKFKIIRLSCLEYKGRELS